MIGYDILYHINYPSINSKLETLNSKPCLVPGLLGGELQPLRRGGGIQDVELVRLPPERLVGFGVEGRSSALLRV